MSNDKFNYNRRSKNKDFDDLFCIRIRIPVKCNQNLTISSSIHMQSKASSLSFYIRKNFIRTSRLNLIRLDLLRHIAFALFLLFLNNKKQKKSSITFPHSKFTVKKY